MNHEMNASTSWPSTPSQDEYDEGGNLERTQNPNGTITRMVYDVLNRPVSTWVGTSDVTGSGLEWTPAAQGFANLVDVSDQYYDTQSAPPPATLSAGGTSTLAATTYYVRITYKFTSGVETPASLETWLCVAANKLLTVTPPSTPTGVSGLSGYNVYLSQQLAVPTFPGSVFTGASTTGGSLQGGATYRYKITALSLNGETTASVEESYTVPAGTNTNQITINWNSVLAAGCYKVYRTVANGGPTVSSCWRASRAAARPATSTTPARSRPDICRQQTLPAPAMRSCRTAARLSRSARTGLNPAAGQSRRHVQQDQL